MAGQPQGFIYDHILEFLNNLDGAEQVAIRLQYMSFNKNCDKVKFMAEVLDKHNVLSDYQPFHEKNNEKSAEYRKNGNVYFSLKQKDYLLALEYYNKSICYAESNSECLATGYSNRSAIYFEWKLYRKCLENIELAFGTCSKLPDKLSTKLKNRQKMCLEFIINNKEPTEENESIILSYAAHSRIPFVAECLKMERNDQFGRFIKTTRELYPGDCIVIERPSAVIIVPEQIYKRCAQCLLENKYSLIPCQHCTAIMYCSSKCRETAYASHHRFECSAINVLYELFNKTHLSALNVVLKLFSNQAYLDKTIEYLMNFKLIDSSNFDYNSNYDYADEYKMIHNLKTNEVKRDYSYLVQRAAVAALLYKFLKTNKFLKEIFEKSTSERNYEDLFLTLIFHNLLTLAINLHSISLLGMIKDGTSVHYGEGVFPFNSLLNHSCTPNLVRFIRNQTLEIILFVIRKIAKGEQIFDNYGPHHCFYPKEIRDKQLEIYNFKCVCEACKHDWPLSHDLKLHPNLPNIFSAEMMKGLQNNNRAVAKKMKSTFINFLNKYDKYYPAAQVFMSQEGFKMCLDILLTIDKNFLQTIDKN